MKVRTRYWFTQSEKRAIIILLSLTVGINWAGHLLSSKLASSRLEPSQSVTFTSISSQGSEHIPQKEYIEVNSADSLKLQSLYGVGPSFARRIIKYRELLGGYAIKNQLLEVYGMDSLRYAGFVERIKIDTSLIRKMDLRTISFKDLLRHPYVDYEMVKAFVKFRDQQGPPKSIEVLWDQGLWADSLKDGLRPYLAIGRD